MSSAFLVVSACLMAISGGCTSPGDSRATEVSVCGWIKEPTVFALWSRLAGAPEPGRAGHVPNAAAITFKTKDDRILSGYKLSSTKPGGAIVGRLLVAQGNAMLSEQLLPSLTGFADAGVEVYIFDYRGYGKSEGKPRLKAIVSDYREMADQLPSPPIGKRFLYGISFGGIVVLNVIGSGATYDRVVIDSTPSRISTRGCPRAFDPLENLPSDTSRMLLIAGQKDTVVPLRDSEDLVTRARNLGARTEVRAEYAHPFMDTDGEIQRSRLELIKSFLLE